MSGWLGIVFQQMFIVPVITEDVLSLSTPWSQASQRQDRQSPYWTPRLPPDCCWKTSMVSPSSMSRPFGVSLSLMRVPSNENRIVCSASPARSQYVDISFFRAVCFFILNWTILPSWPITLRLMCSGFAAAPSSPAGLLSPESALAILKNHFELKIS